MNIKVFVEPRDLMSESVMSTVEKNTELSDLQFASVINPRIVSLIKDKLSEEANASIVIVTESISCAFDLQLLFSKLLPNISVTAVYPHTDLTKLQKDSLFVIPAIVFQIRETLPEFLMQPGSCLIVYNHEHHFKASYLLDDYLSKIDVDCCNIIPVTEIDIEHINLEDKAVIMQTVFSEEDKQETKAVKAENTEVSHRIVSMDRNYKRSYLRNRLRGSNERTLIITRTRHNAHRLEEYLYQGKVRSRIIHANLSEEAKNKVLERFESGELSVLLLPESIVGEVQFSNIQNVFFFDLPDVGIEFKERIEKIEEQFGVKDTISLVTNDELSWIEAMEEDLHWSLPKEQAEVPQRNHNMLRIRDRNAKEPRNEKSGRGRGLRRSNRNNRRKDSNDKGLINTASGLFNANHASKPTEIDFNSIDQPVINENRNPFAHDSFEANVARQNKKRVRQFFNKKERPDNVIQDDFRTPAGNNRSNVKITHRKKRSFDIDDNQ